MFILLTHYTSVLDVSLHYQNVIQESDDNVGLRNKMFTLPFSAILSCKV